MWQVARKGTESITLATLKIQKNKHEKTQNISMKSRKTLTLKSAQCHFHSPRTAC